MGYIHTNKERHTRTPPPLLLRKQTKRDLHILLPEPHSSLAPRLTIVVPVPSLPKQAFRATFATATPAKIEEGIERFAKALARLPSASPTASAV